MATYPVKVNGQEVDTEEKSKGLSKHDKHRINALHFHWNYYRENKGDLQQGSNGKVSHLKIKYYSKFCTGKPYCMYQQ